MNGAWCAGPWDPSWAGFNEGGDQLAQDVPSVQTQAQESQLEVNNGSDLAGFIERWGLGPNAQKVLLSLSPGVLETVMGQFRPKNDQGQGCTSKEELGKECDGKFISFARSIEWNGSASGKGGCDGSSNWPGAWTGEFQNNVQMGGVTLDFDGFVQRWGLGNDAQGVLASLSPEVLHTVMTSFHPKNEQGHTCHSREELGRDCEGKLISFARSIERTAKGKGKCSGKPFGGKACCGKGCCGKGFGGTGCGDQQWMNGGCAQGYPGWGEKGMHAGMHGGGWSDDSMHGGCCIGGAWGDGGCWKGGYGVAPGGWDDWWSGGAGWPGCGKGCGNRFAPY